MATKKLPMKKPEWMIAHEESDLKNFSEIRDALQRIEIKLDPIYETYATVTTVRKWAMGILVFISIILGIIVTSMKIFQK